MDMNWLGLPEERLRERLLERGTPLVSIESTFREVISLHDDLRLAFKLFLENGVVPEQLSIEGWSHADLMIRRKLSPVGAWLYLSWLLKNPEEAKAALATRTEKVTL